MKTVMRPRYYCDFCKKTGGSASHMKTHERGCTMNPSRICRMCKIQKESQKEISELTPLALAGNMKGLRNATGDCPACILAAIRQASWPHGMDIFQRPRSVQDWDFKDSCKSFWNDIAENEEREDMHSLGIY